ncbi:MAG: hypothetical protein V7L02_00780 [Nostoc sp.]|uniref:hypothetical protein n=1 Tax=Nostoc sp. TaxID=1180 RepID=UPI002FF7369C
MGLTTFVQLFNDAVRNLFDRRDIHLCYDKLIHANGVCYTDIWKITEDSPYTGYFTKGSEGLVFARLSVAGAGMKNSTPLAGWSFWACERSYQCPMPQATGRLSISVNLRLKPICQR